MARSIHTTRRRLREHLREDYADRAAKRDRARELRSELGQKRRIKDRIAEERSAAHEAAGEGAPIDPAAIPILVEPAREHVVHGATPEDIIAVLRRLPPGVADGIPAIRLGLGVELQHLAADDDDDDDDDDDNYDDDDDACPLTGRRPSIEILPGVHSGRVLGCYFADTAEIHLCAFVHEAVLAERRAKALYLKLRALTALVHEVAHHHDYTARVGRGRWRADRTALKELYAERMEHAWGQEVVIPYLEEAYAEEVAFLRGWLQRHGGADVPLRVLADDPRLTRRDGLVRFRFTATSAFRYLLQNVEGGGDPLETRIELARELHYTDGYEIPREILAGVLADHPEHSIAHALLADIDVHEDHFAAAEARVREVLARDPDCFDAWEVLTEALRSQERWADVIEAATRGFAVGTREDAGEYEYGAAYSLLQDRARAHLERGDREALEHDLRGLALGARRSHRRCAGTLRAMQLLRQGDDEAALALAARLLGDRMFASCVELAAVRFEAAHRLGRADDAPALTAAELDRLRLLGHSRWAERLAALAAHASI